MPSSYRTSPGSFNRGDHSLSFSLLSNSNISPEFSSSKTKIESTKADLKSQIDMLRDELEEANRVIQSMQRSRREFSIQMNSGLIRAIDEERAEHKDEIRKMKRDIAEIRHRVEEIGRYTYAAIENDDAIDKAPCLYKLKMMMNEVVESFYEIEGKQPLPWRIPSIGYKVPELNQRGFSMKEIVNRKMGTVDNQNVNKRQQIQKSPVRQGSCSKNNSRSKSVSSISFGIPSAREILGKRSPLRNEYSSKEDTDKDKSIRIGKNIKGDIGISKQDTSEYQQDSRIENTVSYEANSLNAQRSRSASGITRNRNVSRYRIVPGARLDRSKGSLSLINGEETIGAHESPRTEQKANEHKMGVISTDPY